MFEIEGDVEMTTLRDTSISLRQASASDYDWIIDSIDAWWGGRPMAAMLPRLFLDHFYETSWVAESANQGVGFLVGFYSPAHPSVAYIHFVGVNPQFRRHGVGRLLYENFFDAARRCGLTHVTACTAVINTVSVAFHTSMGFSVTSPISGYNGAGSEMVEFLRTL